MNSSDSPDPKSKAPTDSRGIPRGPETYGCQLCRCRFKGIPGMTSCPVCPSPYVKWLSYPQFLARKRGKVGNGAAGPPQARKYVRKPRLTH